MLECLEGDDEALGDISIEAREVAIGETNELFDVWMTVPDHAQRRTDGLAEHVVVLAAFQRTDGGDLNLILPNPNKTTKVNTLVRRLRGSSMNND